ncbi:cytochrome c biogenesis protein ResB [Streptomyces coelicoflavus]|uniref:cytochrome c biogenesis protein ResB n=1 Tax=Streptomyces coelicoflavus TaxID=285562 RepID=UPI0036790252
MSTTSKSSPGTDPGTRPKADGDPQDLGAAGSQLSTAPAEETPNLPSLGVIGWARWFWRQLTSMRVALILLLLVSLGAIPGSLIPQDGVDAMRVEEFRDNHDILGPVYDKLGFFHVYSSVWFSAIYILLFVSLIGCIVPRTWQFVGQLRGRPPRAPRRLDRLPAYTTWRTGAEPEEVREAARKLLKKRHFRVDAAGDAVAAEKGYLREVGNLAFHIALIVLLIAFAWGQLFKYEGNKLILEGDGFSNTLTQYDDFKSGNLFDPDHDLAPFSFTLKDFHGTYEATGPNRGTPRIYEAQVTYSEGADGAVKSKTVEVNKPLNVDGSKVYLVSHGYAPILTVKDAKGDVVMDKQAVALLPLDGNVTSSGAVKVMDGYRNAKGEKEQLGFNAFFLPTYGGKGSGMQSTFPALMNPMLALSAYHGDLGVDAGIPQSIYQLDKTNLEEFKDSDGKLFKQQLAVGDTMTLPNGAGTVTFNGVQEWAGFQVTRQPASGWALGGAVVAIFGLAGSLFIQRRRVWVRAVRGADGVTVVEMAGLGRSESAKLPEELGDLAGVLYDQAPGAPDSSDTSDASDAPENDDTPDSPDTPDTHAVTAEGAEKK